MSLEKGSTLFTPIKLPRFGEKKVYQKHPYKLGQMLLDRHKYSKVQHYF